MPCSGSRGGGLHADELPGMVILSHLVRLLQERESEPNGEIIIVPCANPIGLSQRVQGYHAGRSDLGLGGNFNRNFPNLPPW
ncbi:succinylglutamate desuccinylase/aspartoacylase family protein [Mesorhizobium sp. M0195]|uniref:succinylglutamate desuccinylase/aspartoacylase domain-containing protein n=1 Tax=unclassified Mesorhizobium TaxID=325217 RepID=UPI00333BD81B